MQYSNAPFKFVCIGSQVLNTAQKFENYSNYVNELNEILEAIDAHGIKNVVFLTGDRHQSEISEFTSPSMIKMYDITSSPLTSSSRTRDDEVNRNRIQGSLILQRNYTKINIAGKRKERVLTVSFHDVNGIELYRYSWSSQLD